MKKRALIFLVAACLYLGLANTWVPLFAGEKPQVDVKEYVLANGMKVLVLERYNSPTVACYLYFRVGSINEQLGSTGISHLLEHMLSRGTDTIGTTNYAEEKKIIDRIDQVMAQLEPLRRAKAKQVSSDKPIAEDAEIKKLEDELKGLYEVQKAYVIPKEYDQILTRNGAAGLNAATNKYTTYYYCSLPVNKLELWMWLESDSIVNPAFRGFYEERSTVLEERSTRSEVDPDGIFWEEFDSLFYKAYPLRRPIIGWRTDTAALTRQDLQDYLRQYYAPNNAVAVFVGAVKAEEVLHLAKKYFEPIPAGKPIPPIVTQEPEQVGERRVTIEFDSAPKMMIGYKGTYIGQSDDYTMDVISQILSGGRTSRLYKKMVLGNKLCLNIGVSNSAGKPADTRTIGVAPGCIGVYAVPTESADIGEIEKNIYEELDRLKTEPVTDEELEKARNNLQVSFLKQLNSNDGMAESLGYNEMLTSWRYLLDWLPNCQKVSKDDIMKVAQKYFVNSKRTVAVMVRKKAEDQEK